MGRGRNIQKGNCVDVDGDRMKVKDKTRWRGEQKRTVRSSTGREDSVTGFIQDGAFNTDAHWLVQLNHDTKNRQHTTNNIISHFKHLTKHSYAQTHIKTHPQRKTYMQAEQMLHTINRGGVTRCHVTLDETNFHEFNTNTIKDRRHHSHLQNEHLHTFMIYF